MILKFNEYKAFDRNSTRGKTLDISWEEAIEKYAPWYDINCSLKMYRGSSDLGDVRIIEPKKYTRYPLDDHNAFYQIFLDVDERFPKRSNSIIMANEENVGLYGRTIYRVIPFKKGSRVAFAPAADIWQSFEVREIFEYLMFSGSGSLSGVSGQFRKKLLPDGIIDIKDWELSDMKNHLDKVSKELYDNYGSREWFFKEGVKVDWDPEKFMRGRSVFSEGMKDIFFERYPGGLFEFFNKIVSYDNPRKRYSPNKFVMVEYDGENKPNDHPSKMECWTDEPCLLIDDKLIPKKDDI